MTRFPFAAGLLILACATAATGQEPPVEIPPVVRKPYSVSGILELRPVVVWQDTGAALFELREMTDGASGARALQANSRVQLDIGYRRGWFSAQTRSVVDAGYAAGDWSADATAYEAYVSMKPAPSLAVDLGKKTLKWGKGYLFNPAAFLDRPKNPEDPALALEGFTVLSADYIRTFEGPLQAISVTPVLVPVFGDLNEDFGRRDYLNAAGRLYLLLLDTDIDVMFLTGGSRPGRYGFDVSRNLRSNVEIHGEWARVPRSVTTTLAPDGALVRREEPATSLVAGFRYLTTSNTTLVVDYFWNGGGYTSDEMDVYFDAIHRGYERWTAGGGDTLPASAAGAAAAAGYGGLYTMRHYGYGRITQPDAFGVLYLTLGASAIVNIADGSHSLLPEVQYRPTANLELRWLANILRGGRGTEFGEKQADLRIELRARYYF